jgi:hypothetical protein
MSEFVTPLGDLGEKVTKLTMEIGMKAFQNQDEVGAAAVPYLRVVGHLVFSLLLRADGEDRAGEEGFGRQVLRIQAGHRALLLRPPVPGNRDADPPGRSGAANLLALDAVLTRTIKSNRNLMALDADLFPQFKRRYKDKE